MFCKRCGTIGHTARTCAAPGGPRAAVLAALQRNTGSIRSVARRLGVDPTTVKRIAARHGVPPAPGAYSSHVRGGLTEIVIDCLGRVPIGTRALYERVVTEYGELDLRVFYAFMVRVRARKLVAFETDEKTRQIVYWRLGVSPLR